VQIGSAASLLLVVWLGVRLYVGARGAQSLPVDLARNAEPLVWSARVLWQLLYLSIVATVVTFLLWTWGQARMSATHAAIIFSLEPVFATLFAYAFYGASEMLNPRAALGATLVLAGVVVSELRLSKTSPDEDEGDLESFTGKSDEEREASTP
jgi:drug/metabolite transporter (DMT)-like permease